MTGHPDRDATTAFARTLVDEWVRGGVTDAVVAPGSRSAPVALALAHDGRLRLHVHHDERSAAFFALGLGRATGRPAVVLCTSGTAAANLHPAVLEAHHGAVPLLVCTADRPPELRGVGAPQTIDQRHLFGDAPRWAVDADVPEARADAAECWRTLAARAVAEARGLPRPGPVHLNLPFREPLVPTGAPLVDARGRAGGAPWRVFEAAVASPSAGDVDDVVAALRSARRGVLVAGWGAPEAAGPLHALAAALGWPVLADPLSGARHGPHAVAAYDAILRDEAAAGALAPDTVVRIGAPLTSKVTNRWLDRAATTILFEGLGRPFDPDRQVTATVAADPASTLSRVAACITAPATAEHWMEAWRTADGAAMQAIACLLDHDDAPFEGRVARDVFDAVPEGSEFVVASSMPVRDLDTFAPPRPGVRVHANRGVNGIDGFVSTTLGIAAATPDAPTVALLGDLCFLHDVNGLLGAHRRGIDAVFVVVDNDGGGIFSFLPQASEPEHFETLFGTPHGSDLGAIASAYGVGSTRVDRATDVLPEVRAAIARGGVHLLHVRTERRTNVARHDRVWRAVADAVRGALRDATGGAPGPARRPAAG